MILLPNGCSCSGQAGDPLKGTPPTLSVHPENWLSPKAPLRKGGKNLTWYIQYRFYDPAITTGPFRKGKLVIIKCGNNLPTVALRQKVVRDNMQHELDLLLVRGYNPITVTCSEPAAPLPTAVDPETPFVDALDRALEKLDGVKGTLEGAAIVVTYVKVAAAALRFADRPVGTIRTSHLTVLLDYMQKANVAREPKEGKEKPPFTAAKFNRYRSNLVMLFKKLKTLGAVEANYAEGVERKKKVRKIRITLTDAERKAVRKHLEKTQPAFYRFVLIFFQAGVRETEIMALKARHVRLEDQSFRVTIKKGREYKEVDKVIIDSALPLWVEALAGAGPDDYVFAEGFRPGPKPIHANVVSRWWKRHVKKPLGIAADFYALKHLASTEVTDALGEQAAARLNSHTTTEMVAQVYDVRQKIRRDDKLKKVAVRFA